MEENERKEINPNENGSKEKKMDANIKKEIFSWLWLILSAFIIAFLLKTFIFQIAYVKGPSMEPTLHEGQVLIISKLNYRFGTPHRGDIVVLSDKLENKDLIKRIIGMPGENLEVKENKVYIDGKELNPDYTQAPTFNNDFTTGMVPQQSYFVLGDNRIQSRDSRSSSLGFVNGKNIVGKAVFRIWPFNKIGTLK